MGCFLSCFRGGSDPSGGDLRDPLVRESRLGDAFLSDEKKFDEATGKRDVEAANGHGVDEELRREANYLKSCGTISRTPPEILDSNPINSEDASELMKDAVLLEENSSELLNSDEHVISRHEQNIDEGTLKVGSETQSSLEEKPSTDSSDSPYPTPLVLRGDSVPVNSKDADESNDTPSNDQLIKDATLLEGNSSELLNSDEHDVSRHEHIKVGSDVRDQSQSTDSTDSPYPTPLVLRGDIQTPGTYYTAYKETSKPGKRTRASRQFIYPVLRPIENKMQWMELKAESPVLASNPPKRRNLCTDSSNNSAVQNEMMSPEEPKGQNVNQLLDESELSSKQYSEFGKHGVTSLSHWLKPSSANDETGSSSDDGNYGKETCYETSASDVPIFPAFGLNWETDNPTPVLPKAWDGNGIPNTTTKYKEDQKVNWHATPFEERLMKVLSDNEPHPERKISGKLIQLEENAEE